MKKRIFKSVKFATIFLMIAVLGFSNLAPIFDGNLKIKEAQAA